jgi:hypothetical protein
VLLKLFRVCPATTRDRLVDSPHWLFRPLSRFQGAPGDQWPPGTRRTRRTEPGGGGGALNPSQRFDPIGPAAGRALTLRRRFHSLKSDPGTREQGNTIHAPSGPQPEAAIFSRTTW